MNIQFNNPTYLWMLAVIPIFFVIHLATLKKAKSVSIRFSNFEAIERVAKGDFLGKPYGGMLSNRNIFTLLMRTFVYVILVFAISGTMIEYEGFSTSQDYIFAIDASSSMLAEDFSPNRLEAAKFAATSFVDIVPKSTQMGVISFSGSSIINREIDPDHDKIKEAIKSINIMETSGTNIGDAIITSVNQFKSEMNKTIILLTDGQSNIGTPIEDALRYAKQKRVVIHTLGIATEEGASFLGLNITSKIDENILKTISASTHGTYFRIQKGDNLTQAFSSIALSQKQILNKNISWILLLVGFILLAVEWAVMNTKYRVLPQ